MTALCMQSGNDLHTMANGGLSSEKQQLSPTRERPAIARTPRARRDCLTVADNILEFLARWAAHTGPDHDGRPAPRSIADMPPWRGPFSIRF